MTMLTGNALAPAEAAVRGSSFMLEAYACGVIGEVHFNDWPAARFRIPDRRIQTIKLNPWMIEGQNSLKVYMTVTGEPTMEVRVATEHPSDSPHPEATHVFFRFHPDHALMSPSGLTLVFEHTFDMPSAFGRYRWQDAMPYAEGDDARILARLGELHHALAIRDMAAALALLDTKLEEMARATGQTHAVLRAKQAAFLERYFSFPDWIMEPIDPRSIRIESTANGRLVEVTTGDYGPALRGGGGDYNFMLDVTMSHLDTGWTLTR